MESKMGKLQMKKTVLLNIAALTAAVAMGNTTWYRNCNMNTSNKAYLQKLQYWNNANGQAGSGDVSATDDLVLNGSIGSSNPGRLRTSGITFNGNSLSIGEVGGSANELCHDPGKFTFANEGVKLCNGNWFINGNGFGSFDIAGPMTVYSPVSAPFAFHVGQGQYSNAVVRLQGLLAGASDTGLLFGNYGKSLTSARCTTFKFSNVDEYAGSLTARVKSPLGLDDAAFDVRLMLPVGAKSSASVIVHEGCEVGVDGCSSVAAVGSLTLAAGSGLNLVTTTFDAPSCLEAAAYSQEGVVQVRMSSTLPAIDFDDLLPILRAPKTATFTKDDFLLVGANGKMSLVVRETDTARELCLVNVDSRRHWVLKEQITSSGSYVLGDLSYFRTFDGETGKGAPTVEDCLLIPGDSDISYRLRTHCGSFTGYSLQLGNGTEGCDVVLDDSSRGRTLSFADGTGGLLLARGELFFNIAGSYTIAGSIKVLDETAADPFAFVYGNYTYSNKTSIVTGPIAGGAKARLSFGIPEKREKASSAPLTTFLVGDVAGYEGALEVCNFIGDNVGSYFGVRLLVDSQRTPASVKVQKAGDFGVSGGGELSVESLEFKDTGRLYVGGTNNAVGCVVARDGFSFSNGICVNFNATINGEGLQRQPILVTPLAADAFSVEDVVLEVGPRCLNGDLALAVEEDAQAGTRTLYAVAVGVVSQVLSLSGPHGQTPGSTVKESSRDWCYFSSLTNGPSWSDALPVHGGCHYYTMMAFHTLYEGGTTRQSDYVFPGLSLTLGKGGQLFSSAKSFQVPELVCRDGSLVQLTMEAANISRLVATNIVMQGNVQLVCHQGRTLKVDGPISGAGTLVIAGDKSTSNPKANFELCGDNSGYLGSIVLDMYQNDPKYTSFENLYPTLFINAGASLGGALAEFEPRAFTLRKMGRLSVTNKSEAVVLNTANRGVYVYDCGRFFADAGTKLVVDEPLLLNGTMWKEGSGALTLGGAMSHEVEAQGMISETPVLANSNRFVVAAGTVFAGHVDAFRGLETTFDGNVTFGVRYDPNDADLLRYGARNVCVDKPFSLANGAVLALQVDVGEHAQPQNGATVGLVTVKSSAADSVEAMLRGAAKKRGWEFTRQTLMRDDNGDDTITFSLKITSNGTCILLR